LATSTLPTAVASQATRDQAAPIRIGTRGSALALAQARIVGRSLAVHGVRHEIVVIETAGDRRAPDTSWGEGAFVTAIEQALVDGRVDAAVHSAKDVPTEEDPRLLICSYVSREEPLDALVLPAGSTGSINDLAAGIVVGTDSPRRTGFLRAHRPDLDVRPLHGNVDTRLRRLDDGAVDALLLAAAGLIRLGLAERISELVPLTLVPPAPGQGAICVQVRAEDAAAAALIALIDDQPTRKTVEAERDFLRASGGGCRAPIGALAKLDGEVMELWGGFATLDGHAAAIDKVSGPSSQGPALAKELARRLTEVRVRMAGAPRVLVTRPEEDGRRFAALLGEHGVAGVIVPAIEIEIISQNAALADALARLGSFDLAIVTSRNGARAVRAAAARLQVDISTVRWAAVGRATARELVSAGVGEVWLPDASNAATLASQLPVTTGGRILWVRGELADEELTHKLRERNAHVEAVVAYRTIQAPSTSRALLADALEQGPIDGVVLASASAVRGLVELADDRNRPAVLSIPALCVGVRTAEAARAAGFQVVVASDIQAASALAELTAAFLARRVGASVSGAAT